MPKIEQSFPLKEAEQILKTAVRRACEGAIEPIRGLMGSKTLKAALRVLPVDRVGGEYLSGLYIPHFWAVMAHDGHRSFGPVTANYLVYFRNEADDPRKPRPERVKDMTTLWDFPREYQRALAMNKALQERNPAGGPFQHMVIMKNVHTGRPLRAPARDGEYFFSDIEPQVLDRMENMIADSFQDYLERYVPRETVKIRVRL